MRDNLGTVKSVADQVRTDLRTQFQWDGPMKGTAIREGSKSQPRNGMEFQMSFLTKDFRPIPVWWERLMLRLLFAFQIISRRDVEWLLTVLKNLGYSHAFAIRSL
ncbi:hypothetical protein [Microvirga flavescens]|uniref:hypothetical protein n=1 Tax=Microvirga flavescens TaxID=2249811 RepID=UPI000DD942A8|nr:hypothetical protein [Microvirga flavescens]